MYYQMYGDLDEDLYSYSDPVTGFFLNTILFN